MILRWDYNQDSALSASLSSWAILTV